MYFRSKGVQYYVTGLIKKYTKGRNTCRHHGFDWKVGQSGKRKEDRKTVWSDERKRAFLKEKMKFVWPQRKRNPSPCRGVFRVK